MQPATIQDCAGLANDAAMGAAPAGARQSAWRLGALVREGIGSHVPLLTRLSVLTCVSMLCAGMGFLVTACVANVLGKSAFGELALAVSLGTCGGVIVRFGMDRTLVRDLIHFSEDSGRHIAASLVVRGGVFLALVAGLGAWQICFPSRSLPWEVAAIAAAIALASLDMQGAYDAAGRTNRHAINLLAQKAIYLIPVALVVLVAPARLSLGFIAASMVCSVLIGLSLQMPWAMRQVQWRPIGPILKLSAASARSNAWIWLSAVGCLSFGTVTQIILQGACGNAELGAYAAAWQIASVITLALYQVGRLGNAAVSRITVSGTSREVQVIKLRQYCAVMLMAGAGMALPVIIAPGTVLSWFFASEYAPAAGLLRLMGAYEIVFALGIVASQYLVCARMVRAYFFTVVACGGAGLVLCCLLTPRWGATGAAVSLLASGSLAIAIQFAVCAVRLRARA